MNIKYYHDFIGADDLQNRFEILSSKNTQAVKIEATDTPFSLQYLDVKKLEPIQGSQATLGLISETSFQFIGLHTDDMQEYMIRFYRAGQLYWIGYLDSELYNENLTDYPPYPVQFSGADFNILKRLKFRDENEKAYADITTLIAQLKRCFNKLGLPFQKLYIGCSTIPEGIALSSAETALHKLYIQSSNFYDEDGEPMTCREVVESILQPFGLMMVQRDASVYIYDLNTVKSDGVMKCYNFSTLSYIGDTAVSVQLGDISDIGTRSTDSSFGFEEMINNTCITSSLYASSSLLEYEVKESNLEDLFYDMDQQSFNKKAYRVCKPWEVEEFILYKSKENSKTLMGALFLYTANDSARNKMFFKQSDYLIYTATNNLFINIKAQAYINTKKNPFDEEIKEDDERTRIMTLYCNLILKDNSGKPIMYFSNSRWQSIGGYSMVNEWITISDDKPLKLNKFHLHFSQKSLSNGRIANEWLTNSLMSRTLSGAIFSVSDKDFQKGLSIPIPPNSGYLELEIKYALISDNEFKTPGFPQIYPSDLVKDLLVNNVEFTIKDIDGKDISTEDYEFKSYINKKVAADFEEITLKCISANEDKTPVGKANILKAVDGRNELQLSYTRASQTNILERLLMCTIHSNFTAKNPAVSVDIKMTDNPVMRYCTYKKVIQSDGMLITGCELDFHNSIARVNAVGFSSDTDKLSSIPYE